MQLVGSLERKSNVKVKQYCAVKETTTHFYNIKTARKLVSKSSKNKTIAFYNTNICIDDNKEKF